MGIGRIASLLSSLSPSSDAAVSTQSADQLPEDSERRADGLSAQQDLGRGRNGGEPNDMAAQLLTMIGAVRQLNDNAMEQGAAVAVSPAGAQLRNAVTGLGHLLAAAGGAALTQANLRQASEAIDAVESGLVGSQAAAEQIFRSMPAQQAANAKALSSRFQSEMREAVGQVRQSLGSFKAN